LLFKIDVVVEQKKKANAPRRRLPAAAAALLRWLWTTSTTAAAARSLGPHHGGIMSNDLGVPAAASASGLSWPFVLALLALLALLLVCASRIVQRALLYQPFVPSREHEATPADKRYGIDFEDLTLRAADGTKLHAWLLKQPILPSRAPTVLFCHGNAGNISHALPFAKVIHGLGLNVLLLEYRGYGRSTGRPTELGLKMDALAAYEYCCSCPGTIDAEKIVIYGRSLGGAVAIALAEAVERRLSGGARGRHGGGGSASTGSDGGGIQRPACVVIENSFTSLGKKTACFPFRSKNDFFTKAGSGQT
jgi:hypothetical protein